MPARKKTLKRFLSPKETPASSPEFLDEFDKMDIFFKMFYIDYVTKNINIPSKKNKHFYKILNEVYQYVGDELRAMA